MKSSSSRMKAMRHSALSIRSAMRSDSNTTTPQSSAYPSAYPTEDEAEDNVQSKKRQPFRFLDLPSELRNKVYGIAFESTPPVIDLDPDVFHILRRIFPLFFVSKQIHAEVAHYFYSTYTFRVFPIHPGRHFKTKKPLLARLTPECRSSITTLELRLGPGWNNPPRGWIVNEALGLKDCVNVRILKIFVECDPSDAIFKGFRRSEGFYETFSQRLLEGILKEVPSVKVVEFDGWSSVKKDGDMVAGLLEAVLPYGKITTWGKESGWVDDDQRQRLVDSALVKAGAGNNVVTRSIAILA